MIIIYIEVHYPKCVSEGRGSSRNVWVHQIKLWEECFSNQLGHRLYYKVCNDITYMIYMTVLHYDISYIWLSVIHQRQHNMVCRWVCIYIISFHLCFVLHGTSYSSCIGGKGICCGVRISYHKMHTTNL